MSEHALHFVIRRGALSGGGRGAISPSPYAVFAFWVFFFGLSAQSRKVMVISGVMSQNIWGGAQSLRGSEATKPEGA